MIKDNKTKKEKETSALSDKTKGAIFLALSLMAFSMICIILYARLDKQSSLNTQVVYIEHAQRTK